MLIFEKGGRTCLVPPANPNSVAVISGDMHLANLVYTDHQGDWRLHTVHRVFLTADELAQILRWIKANEGDPNAQSTV